MTLNFRYVGRNQKGQKVSGVVTAENLDAAVAYLQKQTITPLHIKSSKQNFDLKYLLKLPFFNKIDTQEILSFCRGIAALDEAGVPLIDAITQLSLSGSSKIFSKVLQEIANSISAGKTLAASLRSYPNIFPPLFTNIVEISENTGTLSQAFLQLAAYTEMSQTNRRRLSTTIRYPLTVMCAAFGGGLLVNVLVIPKFAAIFARFKGELPLPTRLLSGFANLVNTYWHLLLVIFVFLIVAIPFLLKIPKVRLFWDKLKLNLPIFGNLQRRIILFQFTWSFSLILRSGMPLIKGLTFSANATGNSYFNNKILTMCQKLEKGESLSSAATATRLFPQSVLQMLAVGEESGRLENILNAITSYYEREVDYDIKRLNDMLEPILLLIIGGMVLILALGIYLPLWQLIDFAKLG